MGLVALLQPASAFMAPGLVRYSTTSSSPTMLFGKKAAPKTAAKKAAKKAAGLGGLFGKKAAPKTAAKKVAKKAAKKAAKKVAAKGARGNNANVKGPGAVQYGVPVFLKSGAVNPEFKKREAAQFQKNKKEMVAMYNKKSDALVAKGVFTLGDFILTKEGKKPKKGGPSAPPTGIFRGGW